MYETSCRVVHCDKHMNNKFLTWIGNAIIAERGHNDLQNKIKIYGLDAMYIYYLVHVTNY